MRLRTMQALGTPLLLAGLIGLSACKPAANPATDQPPADQPAQATATTPAAQTPETTCPDADFAAFLKRFEGSVAVQRTSTADPLTMESIDGDAEPEPAQVTKQVPLAEVEFPVLFGPDKRAAEGLQETVTELGPSQREVRHAVPDSGVQVRFTFSADPCWRLVKVSDDTF